MDIANRMVKAGEGGAGHGKLQARLEGVDGEQKKTCNTFNNKEN